MKQNTKETSLTEVCAVIEANMGLHFPVERWNMLTRNLTLAAAEFGFQHFNDFTNWLTTTTLGRDQLETLASFLTVSETYFWREEPAFDALTEWVLPEIIASKKNEKKSIRIWSAGCSSGEEVYSLAIALHKTIPNLKDWDIKILGTDMNPSVLKKAEAGIYSKWSFRNCPDWLKSGYFRQHGENSLEILPKIRKLVSFQNLNLIESVYPSQHQDIHSFDIIFCRNVLMYFTDEWIEKIVQNLSHSLNPDGWFVVSSCELSSQRFCDFSNVNFPRAILYRKGKKGTNYTHNAPSSGYGNNAQVIWPVELPKIPTHQPASFDIPQFEIPVPDAAFVSSVSEGQKVQEKAIEPELDNQIGNRIRMLANQGALTDALALCNESLASDKLARHLYFLRASILQELNQSGEAIASLKQAIYLDPDFIMGHFVLGNISLQEGKLKQAQKYFDNAFALLNNCPDDEILPESEGLSAKYMREIIVPNIQKITSI